MTLRSVNDAKSAFAVVDLDRDGTITFLVLHELMVFIACIVFFEEYDLIMADSPYACKLTTKVICMLH